MGATGAAIAAVTAINAGTSIMQGHAEQKEANYNASLMQQKAGMIEVQKDIETAKYKKAGGRMWGTAMANVAAMGIKPTGSAMAVMLNAQKEIAIDSAISRFNYDVEKSYTMAEAEAYKRKGKRAMQAGYMGGLSSILRGTYTYATDVGFDTDAGAKAAGGKS